MIWDFSGYKRSLTFCNYLSGDDHAAVLYHRYKHASRIVGIDWRKYKNYTKSIIRAFLSSIKSNARSLSWLKCRKFFCMVGAEFTSVCSNKHVKKFLTLVPTRCSNVLWQKIVAFVEEHFENSDESQCCIDLKIDPSNAKLLHIMHRMFWKFPKQQFLI